MATRVDPERTLGCQKKARSLASLGFSLYSAHILGTCAGVLRNMGRVALTKCHACVDRGRASGFKGLHPRDVEPIVLNPKL